MKHNTDKYNLAWYRLSECVAKGERERALGMYRLLAHSIDNIALVKQLEGDILYLFNDEAAFERYREAAHLYRDRGMFLESLALLEQVMQAPCATLNDRALLIDLYCKTGTESRAEHVALQSIEELIKKEQLSESIQFLSLISNYHRGILVSGMMRIAREDVSLIIHDTVLIQLLEHSVEYILTHSDTHSLDRFIQHIRAHNIHLYNYVQACLDRKDL